MCNIVLIALACLLQVSLAADSGANRSSSRDNCFNIPQFAFKGNLDTYNDTVTSHEECGEVCARDPNCKAFTWQETAVGNNKCQMVSRVLDIIPCMSCESGLSPTKMVGCEETLNYGCVADENTIHATTTAQSLGACLKLCNDDAANCNYVTWFDDTSVLPNLCILLNSCSRTKLCTGCSSWQLNCVPSQCFNYNILDDSSRNVNHRYSEGYCDNFDCENTSPDWQGSGWYRILPPAGTELARNCGPYTDRCGSETGLCAVFSHGKLFDTTSGFFCYHWFGPYGTCLQKQTLTRTNCGFKVYKLGETIMDGNHYNARYCTEL